METLGWAAPRAGLALAHGPGDRETTAMLANPAACDEDRFASAVEAVVLGYTDVGCGGVVCPQRTGSGLKYRHFDQFLISLSPHLLYHMLSCILRVK